MTKRKRQIGTTSCMRTEQKDAKRKRDMRAEKVTVDAIVSTFIPLNRSSGGLTTSGARAKRGFPLVINKRTEKDLQNAYIIIIISF